MLKKSIPFVLIFAALLLSIIGLYFLDKAFAEESVALEQAKSNIISLIQQANYAEAQEQTHQLLTDFAEDEKIAETIWQIAKKYDELQEYDKAFELNQYNIEHFYGIWCTCLCDRKWDEREYRGDHYECAE